MPRVGLRLAAELQAAEVAENRGDDSGKASAILAFQRSIGAYTGVALTLDHAEVLLTLVATH
jgi:hypothetical protein